MSQLRCEISAGLRDSEALAIFQDHAGRRHFLRIERSFITEEGGSCWLPVTFMHLDKTKELALIQLPHEAETGAYRMWVKKNQLDKIEEYV